MGSAEDLRILKGMMDSTGCLTITTPSATDAYELGKKIISYERPYTTKQAGNKVYVCGKGSDPSKGDYNEPDAGYAALGSVKQHMQYVTSIHFNAVNFQGPPPTTVTTVSEITKLRRALKPFLTGNSTWTAEVAARGMVDAEKPLGVRKAPLKATSVRAKGKAEAIKKTTPVRKAEAIKKTSPVKANKHPQSA